MIIVSTYTDGVPPEQAAWFHKYVTEMACDFRFQKDALKGLNYSVCGLGNSLYHDNFNKVAVQLDKSFASMQATRLAPLYLCDENTVNSKHGSLEGDFEYWQKNFIEKLTFFRGNQDAQVVESQCACKTNDDDDSACCKDKESDQSYEVIYFIFFNALDFFFIS